MKTKFLIIRHAESDKTLKKIHGGSGNIITELGKEDVNKLSIFIKKKFETPNYSARIYSSHVQQVKLTAELLGERLSVPVEFHENLKNINMGILDGLSDEEATKLYPDVMERLTKWRAGLIDVKDIKIPNAENLNQFVKRIKEIVRLAIRKKDELSIFIVTRSVGIAILNTLLENTMLAGKGYTRFRLDPCSASLIEAEMLGKGKSIFINNTEFLERTINYPDD